MGKADFGHSGVTDWGRSWEAPDLSLCHIPSSPSLPSAGSPGVGAGGEGQPQSNSLLHLGSTIKGNYSAAL